MKRIAIIGAGITGLTCAYRLAGAGNHVTVYEKSEEFGGLASSFVLGRSTFDYGPHEFCTENPALVEILKEILGDDLLVRQKCASQHFEGKFVDYPLSPLQVIQQLRFGLLLRVVTEVTLQRLKSLVFTLGDYSFETWVANRFGRTMYREYFGPFTKKVWGVDPAMLDPRTASNRIAFNSIFDYVIKATSYFLWNRDDQTTIHSPLKHNFYYARGGTVKLTGRLAEHCVARGVEFRTGWGLAEIEHEDRRVTALKFDNGEIVQDFDYVISTIPVTSLLKSLGESHSHTLIRFRSMIFCFLEIPKTQMSDFSWIYFPDEDVCFQRSTEFCHFRADLNPEGVTGVCLEISCFPEDEVWKSEDRDIIERVRGDLDRLGLLDRSVPCNEAIVRRPFAYPIQVIGFLETIHDLLTPIRRLKNAVSTGRQGLYKYCNMNECMEMAIEVAEQIEAGTESFRYDLDSKWRGAGLESERISQDEPPSSEDA